MSSSQAELLENWKVKVRRAQMAHYAAANRCERRHLYLGVPVVILSAVTGALVFADLSKLFDWVTWAVGFASITISILAGLQTFLKLAERAEQHRVAAGRFGNLKRKLDAVIVSSPPSMEEIINDIREEWNAITTESPMAVSSLWERESR